MASHSWKSVLALAFRRQGHGDAWIMRGLLLTGALACFIFAFDQLDNAYWEEPGPVLNALRLIAILFVVATPMAVIAVLYLRLARGLYEATQRGRDD